MKLMIVSSMSDAREIKSSARGGKIVFGRGRCDDGGEEGRILGAVGLPIWPPMGIGGIDIRSVKSDMSGLNMANAWMVCLRGP
jgi:hypothetical protein